MFEPAKNFTLLATSKYQLDRQAMGALVCEKARQLIAEQYPQFKDAWQPTKFQGNSLTIRAGGSSGGALFMETQALLLKLQKLELPRSVQQIKIVKV